MPRVVILGGGFAGLGAAQTLQRLRKRVRGLEIVVVDRNNYMTFTPLLPEAATGAVEVRAVTQPLRALLPAVRVELGEVVAVDERARVVTFSHAVTGESATLEYDELIVALGSVTATMGVEGVERFTLPLRTVADAQRLRSVVIGALEVAAETADVVERDRLLRFMIVGGGFTGVEAAGELSAFLNAVMRYYPALRGKRPQIVLLQSEMRLLPHLPDRFGKYAARVLSRRGVEIRTGADVEHVDAAGLTLKGGAHYASRTILWDAGTEAQPVLKRLGLPLSEHHAVQTKPDFSIEGHPHVWAIGDCAAVPRKNGGTYAPLAQNATREGPLAARNVIATLRGRATTPFRYRELGQMASLGNRHAVAELPGGFMLTGLAAWLLWRAYYLTRVPSGGRRVRVALDWTIDLAQTPSPARLPMVERTGHG